MRIGLRRLFYLKIFKTMPSLIDIGMINRPKTGLNSGSLHGKLARFRVAGKAAVMDRPILRRIILPLCIIAVLKDTCDIVHIFPVLIPIIRSHGINRHVLIHQMIAMIQSLAGLQCSASGKTHLFLRNISRRNPFSTDPPVRCQVRSERLGNASVAAGQCHPQ